MDWINCNVCCRQPCDEKERLFSITSCGHILCDLCLSKAESRIKCRVCSQQCQLMELSSNMKPEAGMYFQDPVEVLKKHFTQFKRLLEFQRGHRTMLVSFHRRVVSKYKEMEREHKLALEKMHYLEKEHKLCLEKLHHLEKENIKLKEHISGGGAGRRDYIPTGSSGHPQDAYQRVLSASALRNSPQESSHHVSPHSRSVPGRITLLKGKIGSPAYRISPNRVSPNMPVDGFRMKDRESPHSSVIKGNAYDSSQVSSTNEIGHLMFSTSEGSRNSSPFLRTLGSESSHFTRDENFLSSHHGSSVQSRRMMQPLQSIENYTYKTYASNLHNDYSRKKF
ncbi:UNVERIFIED_CONTAM: hypothetical protein RMT77_003211 [Armadillidium vulgare]